MPNKPASEYHFGAKTGILCNTRGGRARGRLREIRGLSSSFRRSVYREAVDGGEISRALGELLREEVEVLVLVGGDGTVQAALTALHSLAAPDAWPVLVALPGGTTNMTARDLGSWPSVEKGLQALQGPGEEAHLIRRPVLRLEGGGMETLGGMFFGIGAVAAGVRFWNRRFHREDLPGSLAVGTTILRLLGSLAFGQGKETLVQRLHLSMDGENGTPRHALLCLASTLDRLLLGTRPYWGGGPGGMHFTLVERGARGLWWRLPRLATGRPGRALRPERGYLSRDPGRVELTFDGPFVVDGEVFEARAEAGPLTLTAVHGKGWLVPSGSDR